MRISILVTIAFCLTMVTMLAGQTVTQPPADSAAFPAAWVGDWQGDLVIYDATGEAQRVPMQLRIHPIDHDRYTWTIVYGPVETGMRDYVLETVDANRGLYRIDEQNSITLESYLLAGKLYSTFEVLGNYLISTVEKQGDTLVYEIISGSTDAVSTTGKTQHGEETIPEVKAYPVRVRQIAYLYRD